VSSVWKAFDRPGSPSYRQEAATAIPPAAKPGAVATDPGAKSSTSTFVARHAAVIAAIFAAVGILAVHAPTAASIVAIWLRSETFAHGFVVIPLSLWLAWRRRDAIAAVDMRPWWPGLALVAGFGLLWLVAALGHVLGVYQFALAFMVEAAIVTVVGLSGARVLAFPLIFLLFAVPAGELLVPTLIDRTADFTVGALRLSGVPVFREANHFVIPSGKWSVVEACSGLRYIIASVMVGTIYAAIAYHSVGRRIAFVLASIVVPIVANWIRAYSIVMLAHLTNNRLAVGIDHILYGWVFFGVVMLLLFWVGSLWREADVPPASRAVVAREPAPPRPATAFFIAAVAAIAVAALWRPLEVALEGRVDVSTPALPALVPDRGWTTTSVQLTSWKPHYTGFAAERAETFAKDGRTVAVYVAYYRGQQVGHELITSANQLVRTSDWNWRNMATSNDRIEWAGKAVEAKVTRIAGSLEPGLEAMSLYWVAGHVTASPYVAKALTAWSKLKGEGDDSALVVIYARTPPDGSARGTLSEFATAMSPALERMLQATRRGAS
jgi:exosortase A